MCSCSGIKERHRPIAQHGYCGGNPVRSKAYFALGWEFDRFLSSDLSFSVSCWAQQLADAEPGIPEFAQGKLDAAIALHRIEIHTYGDMALIPALVETRRKNQL